MSSLVKEFNDYRSRVNEVILGSCNETALEPRHKYLRKWRTRYKDERNAGFGCPPRQILRCDDCIRDHLGKCHELGITTAQVYEIFAVANIVDGTIVIPHTRVPRSTGKSWEITNN